MNEEYEHGNTLLHYAALRGFRKLKEMLQERGAILHAVNSWGKEPLDYVHKFKKEHDNAYQYPFAKFEGIWISWCRKECGSKHKHESKEYVPQKVNQEEIDWLQRSCSYVTDNLHISIKKASQPLQHIKK